MKKVISLLLCVALIICCVPMVFSVETSADFRFEIISGEYDAENSGYRINYEALNGGNQSLTRTLIFGAFKNSGELISVQSTLITLDGGASVQKNITLEGESYDFEGAVLKVFVWSDMDTIEPVAQTETINISEVPAPDEEAKSKNVSYNFIDEQFIALGEIAEPVSVDGLTFVKAVGGKELGVNADGYVSLGGGGTTSDCSLKFRVEGDCRINVWAKSRSTEEIRYVKITDEKNVLAEFEAPTNSVTLGTYDYKGEAKDIYVSSKASGILIYMIEVLYDYDDEVTEFVTTVEDFAGLKKGIRTAELFGGGTVIINADVIDCTSNIVLRNQNENTVTICGGEGFKAILDFDSYRDTFSDEQSTRNGAIRITGSNYHIKDVIVQKAPGQGLTIGQETGCNNVIENFVSRYNNGMGINTNNGANNNTFKNCYSYRNCDVLTKGQNADGIGIMAYSGVGNKLIDCYAWENGDDGFDSFNMFNDVTYENCFAWRNGNPDVFSGKIDFDNGKPLDMNLHLVEKLCEYDPTFKGKYESGVFELPSDEFLLTTEDTNYEIFETISASDFVGAEWQGNPNGLKLGSGSSAVTVRPQVGPEAVRTMTNCIAFEHKSKGFDRNNANCTVYIKNGLAFDNEQLDYWLETCTIPQFENAYSGTATAENRLPSGYSVNHLREEKLAMAKEFINGRIAVLEEMVNNDQIPQGICLEDVFELLAEE